MPGCFVELVDAADVFVGISPALQSQKCSSSLHGCPNNMGAPFHFHFSKVLPGLVLKQTWGKKNLYL